ncbi:2',3'-cyclic-nucleotide 3'-phosphodiesterase-like isoform X2 [Mobula hypostoma]|uniref:2',3'-cyclic-nucleotide 3'-phosphodiesterase-like isoform X2 n=1 Tax=Mobula hypostoma TaxID=723540 RepID=UPI002FC32EC7
MSRGARIIPGKGCALFSGFENKPCGVACTFCNLSGSGVHPKRMTIIRAGERALSTCKLPESEAASAVLRGASAGGGGQGLQRERARSYLRLAWPQAPPVSGAAARFGAAHARIARGVGAARAGFDFVVAKRTADATWDLQRDVEWDSSKDFNLQEYFQKTPRMLHCTTKFCNYGKVPNCESYAEAKVVERSLSKSFVLKVSALFVTPRTAGARVLMDEHQKQLWPEEEEHEGAGSCGDEKALPRGSRSHITLACAPGVQAVQTGIDLLSILKIEEEKPNPEFHITLEEGQLLGLGQGVWIVNLPKPIEVNTIFSGFYAKKESTNE